MKRSTLSWLLGAGLLATLAAPAGAQSPITEEAAHAIGVNAYLYFYPLISADVTRLWSTNIEAGKEPLRGPMNTQAGYKVTPLSQWGKPPQAVTVKIDPTIDMKTPPKAQVDAMTADRYFAYAAALLEVNPPHITDQPMMDQLRKIGIERGKSFDLSKVDPTIRNGLMSAPEDAHKLM